jgi:hypothetical protein
MAIPPKLEVEPFPPWLSEESRSFGAAKSIVFGLNSSTGHQRRQFRRLPECAGMKLL